MQLSSLNTTFPETVRKLSLAINSKGASVFFRKFSLGSSEHYGIIRELNLLLMLIKCTV